MSSMLGASLLALGAVFSPEVPLPPPVQRVEAPPAPPMSDDLRDYLAERGARPARFRYGSMTFEDYPAAAIRANQQGVVVFRYVVGVGGRVTSCEIIESSGSPLLDSTTCSLAQRRFRFYPAQDSDGNPTEETRTQSIRYFLPDDAPAAPALQDSESPDG